MLPLRRRTSRALEYNEKARMKQKRKVMKELYNTQQDKLLSCHAHREGDARERYATLDLESTYYQKTKEL
jgi:hypothetical protein